MIDQFKTVPLFLGNTQKQIDETSRCRTEQISEEATIIIGKIIRETQSEQTSLLSDVDTRSATIEEDYALKLRNFVEELDAAKARSLSALEKELNAQQEMILEKAKRRIDNIIAETNQLKMEVLKEAQALTNAKVEAITEEVAA